MTPNQYRSTIAKLGLSQQGAAEFLGVSLRTSHGYANGDPIPEAIARLLWATVHLGLDHPALKPIQSPSASRGSKARRPHGGG